MGILCSKDYTALEWDPSPHNIEIYDIKRAKTVSMNKSQRISEEDYSVIVKEKATRINNMIEQACSKLEEGVVVYTHNKF